MDVLTAKQAWPLYKKFSRDLLQDQHSTAAEKLPGGEEWEEFEPWWNEVLQDSDLAQSWTRRLTLGLTGVKQELDAWLEQYLA